MTFKHTGSFDTEKFSDCCHIKPIIFFCSPCCSYLSNPWCIFCLGLSEGHLLTEKKCVYVAEWTSSLPYVTLELLSLTFVAVSLNSLVKLKKSDLTPKKYILLLVCYVPSVLLAYG